jgi:RNA 2',3'-cyclic 3'-phosphodiesterase
MRLFIAIALADEWKHVLAQPEHSIGWLGRGVSWVEPRGMHLTLRFLGECPENQVPAIEDEITECCRGIGPFTMQISGSGVFPNPKRPRVYWAGLKAPHDLIELQERLEIRMQHLGFEKEENSFKPHLTLARIKDPIGKERMTEALLSYKIESAPLTVSEILLMRSHLSPQGARYEAIRRFPLQTA